MKRFSFRLARTTAEQRDVFGDSALGFLSESGDGDFCDAEEALAEIAKRDAEIQALHEENARLEGALLDIVEHAIPIDASTSQVSRGACDSAKALLGGEP